MEDVTKMKEVNRAIMSARWEQGDFNNTRPANFDALSDEVDEIIDEAVVVGRVSVLRDFDNMCAADGFVGFTQEEWLAIKRFFAFNKEITGWDKK